MGHARGGEYMYLLNPSYTNHLVLHHIVKKGFVSKSPEYQIHWLQNGQMDVNWFTGKGLFTFISSLFLFYYFRVDKDKSGAITSDELQSALSNGQHIHIL